MVCQIPISNDIRDLFEQIRNLGGAIQNPLLAPLAVVGSGITSAIDALNNVTIPLPEVDELLEFIDLDFSQTIDTFTAHVDQMISSFDLPEIDLPDIPSFSFLSRIGTLQGSFNLLDCGFDPTDTQTRGDKVDSFFGSVTGQGEVLLNDATSVLDEISNFNFAGESTANIQSFAQAKLNDLNACSNDINGRIQQESQSVEQEVSRLGDYSLSTSLQSYSQDPELSQVLSSVLKPEIKNTLGLA